jgi:orotate phosphoribosyltransferase
MLSATSPLLSLSNAEARAELLRLLTLRSFARRLVTLSSGRTSDFYIDVKQTSLSAPGSLLIGRLMLERLLDGSPVTAVGGLTLGADPLVTAISVLSALTDHPIDAFIVRKEPKGHGTGQWLEGVQHLEPGTAVAIVEDVATTGASALRAIERATDHGFRVARVLTVVDRLEGARDALASRGYTLEALFTRNDFIPAP